MENYIRGCSSVCQVSDFICSQIRFPKINTYVQLLSTNEVDMILDINGFYYESPKRRFTKKLCFPEFIILNDISSIETSLQRKERMIYFLRYTYCKSLPWECQCFMFPPGQIGTIFQARFSRYRHFIITQHTLATRSLEVIRFCG